MSEVDEMSAASLGSVSVATGATMDIETLYLRAMTKAIDDWFLRGGPAPNDDVLIAIEPRLACLLDAAFDEPDEDDE